MSDLRTKCIPLIEQAKNGILPSNAGRALYKGEDVALEALDFDSLAAVKFTMLLEEQLNIDMELTIFNKAETYHELISAIESSL